jgi:hypothetical protein
MGGCPRNSQQPQLNAKPRLPPTANGARGRRSAGGLDGRASGKETLSPDWGSAVTRLMAGAPAQADRPSPAGA